MTLERDRLIEIIVAVSSVILMLGTMYWIGLSYGIENGLSAEGGQMLVGVIVGFILLLTAVGVGLAFVLNDPEDGLEDADGDAETDPEADTETKNAV